MITQKKIVLLPIILALLVVGIAVFHANASFAATTKTRPMKVVGMAKFVLQGTVTSVSLNALTVHVSNTSKNAKVFDNKDKTFGVTTKTTITKNGKNILLKHIKSGSTVKVFGIFDKKTGTVTVVRWVKVVSQ